MKFFVTFRKKVIFFLQGVASGTMNPEAGGKPTVDCRRLLGQYTGNYP
jgi:hypothetical protein